jgi:hypothetical protein
MSRGKVMTQVAPYPYALEALLARFTFKKGWEFHLRDIDRGQGSEGLTLNIVVSGPDSYAPERMIHVAHYMIVPPAAYDERAWMRWLLDQIIQVETHEACEFFKVDGSRPFSPNHGPGRNPYSIIEKGSYTDAATRSNGSMGKPERKE